MGNSSRDMCHRGDWEDQSASEIRMWILLVDTDTFIYQ